MENNHDIGDFIVDFIGYMYLKKYSKNLENSKNPGSI